MSLPTIMAGRWGGNVQCRLDRALASNEWLYLFSDGLLCHLEREWSDHSPIKLVLWSQDTQVNLGPKPFRFEQHWATENACEEVVANA